jgi:hypothetical protein
MRGRAAVLALGMEAWRAAQERSHGRWYQFCICDIVSMLRMSIHGVRMFTEQFFTEDDMAKKAKKAKKTAKAATKKVAKKTSKKKK